MRILLMTAFDPYSPTNPSHVIQPPLGLACMVAFTRSLGHYVDVIDGVGLAQHQTWSFTPKFHYRGLTVDQLLALVPEDVDLVGVSVMYTYCYPGVRSFVQRLKAKRPNLTVVLGGEGFSGIARTVIDESHADAIVIGEGEVPFREILARIDTGTGFDDIPNVITPSNVREILVKPSATAEKSPGRLPAPDWNGIPLEDYWNNHNAHGPISHRERYLPLTASRGCAFRCKFCTAPSTWGFQRYRPAEDVIDEVREMRDRYGLKAILFNDLSISTDLRWFEDFIDKFAAAELGLLWQIPSGIRAHKLTVELLSTAKRAGMTHLQLSPETGSERVMDWIEKRFSLDSVRETVVNAKKVGMPTAGIFIVGHPVEELEDYRKSVKFAVELAELGLDEADCTIFTILPGSPSFVEAQKDGTLELNDEFYSTLGAPGDLGAIHTASPFFDGDQLRYMRLQLLMAFYGAKLVTHPSWYVRAFRNVVTGQQQLKSDRVFRSGFPRLVRGMAPVASPGSFRFAAEIWQDALPLPGRSLARLTASPGRSGPAAGA
jgi:anaerobic magnesium-protoporphyrin IX monomethyl ester cyclase